MSKHKLHTIGYSGFKPDAFVRALEKRSIRAVVDVRTSPYSARYMNYNQDRLRAYLKNFNIFYVFLGKELGARPDNQELYTGGHVDFDRVVRDACFLKGIERVFKGLEQFPLTLMCAEKDPARCHRAILVARAFNTLHRDVEIVHIRPDMDDETQGELDVRLMREEKLEGKMATTIGGRNMLLMSPKDQIDAAYKKRGQEIAYRATSMEEEL